MRVIVFVLAQRASTHTSCSAQGQMVHLLGDRTHHAGRLHGHGVVHGRRDHCTLVEKEEKVTYSGWRKNNKYFCTLFHFVWLKVKEHLDI